MSLNWKEIDAILQELSLEGSHIQKIRQPDIQTVVFDLFNPATGRNRILVSLEPGAQRLHRLQNEKAPQRSKKLQRFEQFLRSRVQGGRILRAEQLGSERIILLSIRRAGEITDLYIRLWGGASNIIATDEQLMILDALFRRPGRGEVSGKTLSLPDSTGKSQNPDSFTLRERTEGMSFNEQIEREYLREKQFSHLQELQREAEKAIAARKGRLSRTLRNLERKLEETAQYDKLRETADLLAANAYLIAPGSSWIEVEDYTNGDNGICRISLKPELSPGENVEHYYQKYRKAKGAAENLGEELANIRMQLRKLEISATELLHTGDPDDAKKIAGLEDFLASEKQQKAARAGTERREIPGLQFISGSFTILVGRTSKENDTLLRSCTRGNDYWLHTRDFPGGYVFIRSVRGKSIPLETLLDAGNLALYYSKGRNSGRGELYYTQVKYLRRAKNGKQGLVLPTQEKNLSITLDQKRLDRLFGGN